MIKDQYIVFHYTGIFNGGSENVRVDMWETRGFWFPGAATAGGSLLFAERSRNSGNLREVTGRRAPEHLSSLVEARSVAWAIPGLFRGIPGDDAAQVRTDGGAVEHITGRVLVDGALAQAFPDDGCAPGDDFVLAGNVAGRDPLEKVRHYIRIVPKILSGSVAIES